ncbi:MAG: DUF624 domain-containing protein [Clostridia bacterium]
MAGIFGYKQEQQKDEPKANGKFMGLVNLLMRKIWDITKVNIISFLFYIPFFAIVWLVSYWFIPAEGAGIFNYKIYTPSDSALIDLIRRLMIGSILVTIPITVFGPAAAGATYVYRGFVKGQAVFVWSDMWSNIKKFFWKSMLVTVIDIAILFFSGIAIQFYPQVLDGFMEAAIVYLIVIFLFLFFMMHFYIYQLMIGYNLSVVKLYRYSFVFALLRLFPNLAILILCIFITIAPYAIHIMVGNGLLIFLTIGLCGTIINYYSWPAIEKHFEPLVKK